MNGNLGRDKVWNPDIWGNIDKAVTAEAGQVRVAQKVFPATTMPNAQTVPADIFDPNTMTIQEGQTKALVEVWVPFSLTQPQVDNEATQHTGQKLTLLAAKTVGLAEDIILFQGQTAALSKVIQTANLASAQNGLVKDAATEIEVHQLENTYPESIFQAVVDGIARLTALGQPGPYGLFLENSVYADSYRGPEAEPLDTPADRIKPLVTHGFYPTGALLIPQPGEKPAPFGLLASVGGEPVSIYVGVDAVTEFTQTDERGVAQFRVFERVQYVARDTSALVRFAFVP